MSAQFGAVVLTGEDLAEEGTLETRVYLVILMGGLGWSQHLMENGRDAGQPAVLGMVA